MLFIAKNFATIFFRNNILHYKSAIFTKILHPQHPDIHPLCAWL